MKLKLVLTLLMVLFSMHILNAQEGKYKQKMEDAFTEIEGKLSLRFFDAVNGQPINDAKVTIENIGEFETDVEGVAEFPNPGKNGEFYVKFQHEEYIESEFEIELMAGSLFFNRFSVSPKMPLGKLRVVLDWGKDPRDLDAHLVKEGDYHISFRDMKVAKYGSAQLDRDDTDSYGPETITINNVDHNKEYKFYVHDYTNRNQDYSKELSKSKATVKVYGNNELLEVYQVPENIKGDEWGVFKIRNNEVIRD